MKKEGSKGDTASGGPYVSRAGGNLAGEEQGHLRDCRRCLRKEVTVSSKSLSGRTWVQCGTKRYLHRARVEEKGRGHRMLRCQRR